MNKAFVREPEDDGRAVLPALPVARRAGGGRATRYARSPESRAKLLDDAWFCNFPRCDVAYFNQFDAVVTVDELRAPVYPKDPDAPLCACFGFTYDDVVADVHDGTPTRIRALLARSKSRRKPTASRSPPMAAAA